MTSFPTWTERNVMEQSDFGRLLPFDMETLLRERGADLRVYDRQTRTNHEIVDAKNRLVTASFASSGLFVARAVHRLVNQREAR